MHSPTEPDPSGHFILKESLGAGKPHFRLSLALWLIVAAALCGCIPLRFTTSPGASGRIVDATTGSPINGAEVVVSRSTYPPESTEKAFSNSRSPKVLSSQNGGFSLPAERRMDIYCIPVDGFSRFGLLVVKHDGYVMTCVPFWSHTVAELGEIRIKPIRQ